MESEHEPLKSGKDGSSKSPYFNPTRPIRKNKNLEEDNEEGEINPAKFDREKTEPDQEGRDDSKAHEPYELKQTPSKKALQGKLVGQGGYGTLDTSGTNLDENRGY